MAEYISFQPSDYYSTTIYDGTTAEHNITDVGFQPDFVWLKSRSNVLGNYLFDSVRGATYAVASNGNDAQFSDPQYLKSFDATGFTLGTNTAINGSGIQMVDWNWKMGTTSGLSGGTITPSGYSINTTAGQSIIAYTGNGSAGATIPHGLGVVPDMVIVKKLSTTGDWWVYHSSMDTTPQDYHIVVNSTAAKVNNNGEWYDTAPTSTLVTLGANTTANTVTYIAYCFASKKGYSIFNSYAGNNNANGAFVYTGFRPAFLLIKDSSGVTNWTIRDSVRSTFNPSYNYIYPNLSNAGTDVGPPDITGSYPVDFLSNGFKIRNTDGKLNTSGNTYIYAAFAEFPTVSSNDIPGVAR